MSGLDLLPKAVRDAAVFNPRAQVVSACINWNKDRCKDVESAPLYHLCMSDQINDHHLTLAAKRAVRDKRGLK